MPSLNKGTFLFSCEGFISFLIPVENQPNINIGWIKQNVGFYGALNLIPLQYINVLNPLTHYFYMSMISVLSL